MEGIDAIRIRELPHLELARSRVTEPKAIVLSQIAGQLGNAVPLKIGWRRAQDEAKRSKATRHQARIGQCAAADHCIQLFFDHIDEAIIEVDVQLYVGIPLAKLREYRQKETVADRRHAYAEPTAWSACCVR